MPEGLRKRPHAFETDLDRNRLAIVLHDSRRDVMRLHTLASLRQPVTTEIELPIAESPAGIAWQTQRPVVVPSLDSEARFRVVTQILRAEGMRSYCVLPLTSPLRRLGGLSFASTEADAFGDAEAAFLQELASQVALAVDNALHHEDAQRAVSSAPIRELPDQSNYDRREHVEDACRASGTFEWSPGTRGT